MNAKWFYLSICLTFSGASTVCASEKSDPLENLFFQERYEEALSALGTLPKTPQNLLDQGRMLVGRHQMHEAKNKLSEAHLLFLKANDERRVQQCVLYLAVIEAYKGKLSEAERKLRKALIYFLAHKEPLYAAEASYYLAQLSLHKCQFSSAKTALRKAITFYKKTPYAYEEAKCLVLLGQADLLRAKWHGAKNRFLAAINLKKNNDHPQEAVLIYQTTAALARQLGDQAKEAMALQGLGVVSRSLEAFEDAQESLKQALQIFQKIHHVSGQAYVLYEVGQLYAQQKRSVEGMDAYQKAYVLAEDIADTHLKIFLWRAIGALDGEQGKFAEACRSYQTAYELAESSGNKKEMGKTLWHWGALMLKNKGTQGGFRKLNRAFDIAQELDDTLSQAHILSDLAEGHHSAGNIQEASKLAKGALAIYQHLEHAKGIERTTAFLKRLEPAALPPP